MLFLKLLGFGSLLSAYGISLQGCVDWFQENSEIVVP